MHPNEKSGNERNKVFLFYISFFLMLCSGRGDASDARAQLQTAMSVVYTGSLHIPAPTDCANVWVASAPYTYYEMHDIGATLLFLPAAAINALLSHQTADDAIYHPGVIARAIAVLSYLFLSALTATLIYNLFARFYSHRNAFLLSLAFVTTTIFWAYTKTSWDVMGGCAGIAALLYVSAILLLRLREGRTTKSFREGVALGAAFCCAATFRLSLAPFFLVTLLMLLVSIYRTYETHQGILSLRRGLATLLTIGLGMTPSAWYNFVRTGNPLRTATTGHYAPGLAMQGNPLIGLYGLTFSPGRGIFVYAPILVLLFFLPLVWRKIEGNMRRLLICFGVGTVLYIGAIAKMDNWSGGAGWGARYLVPVLPVLFLGSAVVLVELWKRHMVVRFVRPMLMLLLLLSFVLNLVPVLANHMLLEQNTPAVFTAYPSRPEQQIAAWNALFWGLEGKELPVPSSIASDPSRHVSRWFPDIAAVQLWNYSLVAGAVYFIITVLSSVVCLVTLRQIIGRKADKTSYRKKIINAELNNA